MIEVFNRQRKVEIDLAEIERSAARIFDGIPEIANKSLSVAFISDRKMRELNLFYRNKNATTDVLSFPAEAEEFGADEHYLGDIAISLEQAAKQAAENNLSFEAEIRQLILHGILHLCGYDHETDAGEMNTRELKLRGHLKI